MRVDVSSVVVLKYRLQRTVADGREQNRHLFPSLVRTLACLQVEIGNLKRLHPFYLLPVLHEFRTLGHDDHIGMEKSFGKVAQSAERQQAVLARRTVVIDEDDIECSLK